MKLILNNPYEKLVFKKDINNFTTKDYLKAYNLFDYGKIILENIDIENYKSDLEPFTKKVFRSHKQFYNFCIKTQKNTLEVRKEIINIFSDLLGDTCRAPKDNVSLKRVDDETIKISSDSFGMYNKIYLLAAILYEEGINNVEDMIKYFLEHSFTEEALLYFYLLNYKNTLLKRDLVYFSNDTSLKTLLDYIKPRQVRTSFEKMYKIKLPKLPKKLPLYDLI